MKKLISFLTIIFVLIFTIPTHAQADSEFGSAMRSSGRIYVVVAVMLTILAGIIFYLVRLDRRIGKMEKEINS